MGETLEFNNTGKRLKNMLRVAFGQSKMVSRPVAGILHRNPYPGFRSEVQPLKSSIGQIQRV